MAFFADGDRQNRSELSDMRNGDGALDALIIMLLVAFTFAIWFLCGVLTPMLSDTNPTLMTHPAPISGPYAAGSVAERSPSIGN